MIFLLQKLNRLYSKLLPLSINVHGSKMFYNSFDRFLAELSWKYGILEAKEIYLFKKLVRPGMTVIDVGANMGVYTLLASKLVGEKGKVISFEPDPSNFCVLQKNCLANKCTNVEILNLAVSDKEEELYFNNTSLNSGDFKLTNTPNYQGVKVNTVKLDSFIEKNSTIDVIKMDIQGAEFMALKGTKNIIENNKNIILFIEYWEEGMHALNIDPDEFKSMLFSFNLNLYLIEGKKKFPLKKLNDLKLKNPSKSSYFNLVLTNTNVI